MPSFNTLGSSTLSIKEEIKEYSCQVLTLWDLQHFLLKKKSRNIHAKF